MNKEDMKTGKLIYKLIKELFPITRSITGNGVRETLNVIQGIVPAMEIEEVPSGTKVFDWKIPKEWNIREAYIKNSRGEKIISLEDTNLHVVGYSRPIHKKMPLKELKNHIHTLPEHPEWIPFITSYYDPTWGFCMTHDTLKNLRDEEYEVCIDSTLEDGYLTYGEYLKKGEVKDEFLLSCYICHPSMANDSLSGVALLARLAKELEQRDTYYSYRFLFIPETIGSITWLAKNEAHTKHIKYGLVATCLGDPGHFTYKRSRRGKAEIDSLVEYVLDRNASDYVVEDFFPFGSDERQFCSPGFNLPVGSLMRSRYHKYDEYHTSADDMDLIDPKSLEESYNIYLKVLELADLNHTYIATNPKCEPNLGKRGLFKKARTYDNYSDIQRSYFWLLNYSDGEHSLLDIAKKSGIPLELLNLASQNLKDENLLK